MHVLLHCKSAIQILHCRCLFSVRMPMSLLRICLCFASFAIDFMKTCFYMPFYLKNCVSCVVFCGYLLHYIQSFKGSFSFFLSFPAFFTILKIILWFPCSLGDTVLRIKSLTSIFMHISFMKLNFLLSGNLDHNINFRIFFLLNAYGLLIYYSHLILFHRFLFSSPKTTTAN